MKAEMKYLLLLTLMLFLFSCKNKDEEYHKPENALDAGREFIDQSLKGRFNTAKRYMLQDEYHMSHTKKCMHRAKAQTLSTI